MILSIAISSTSSLLATTEEILAASDFGTILIFEQRAFDCRIILRESTLVRFD